MANARLDLTRAQILAHRRRVGALDERLAFGARSLRQAAWAGLQDSMPRAALLSIHARVARTAPDAWEHPSLVQVWGPRFSAYVVAARDHVYFTLGRLPETGSRPRVALEVADRLHAFLARRRMGYGEAGHAMGMNPNRLRYATLTGRVLIRWEGARQPMLWTVPAPAIDAPEARRELARRHLHVLGPSTSESFARWAGVPPASGRVTFDALERSLSPVRTPIGDAWILSDDEASFRAAPHRAAAVRLLPSGDAYFLLQGADRALLVPDARRRGSLWTPRVWPGAVLVAGEVVGVWRRDAADVTIEPWRRLTRTEREAVAAEAESLPLPEVRGRIRVQWRR